MAANRTNWRHRINNWYYISPKACQYLVSTRINRMETVFPCHPFLLFVLCLLSRSSWNLYAPAIIGVGQIIIIIHDDIIDIDIHIRIVIPIGLSLILVIWYRQVAKDLWAYDDELRAKATMGYRGKTNSLFPRVSV